MNNNERDQGLELDISRVFTVLWRRIWVILLAGVLMAAAAFGYAWLMVSPVYEASAKIYVRNVYDANNGAYSQAQIDGAKELAQTYMVLLDSRPVWEQVQQKTGLEYSEDQLRGMVGVNAINETEVFQIVVRAYDYKHAAMIATALTDVLPGILSDVVEGGSVRVVEYPVEDPKPVGPSYAKYMMLGAVMGVFLSAAVIILLDLMDNYIDTESYLTNKYEDIPLLAVIPCDDNGKYGYHKSKGYYATDSRK
ncbi:MAG: hypothetical protein J6Q92_06475 [Oscillospiraceae bacterium]|nr:hypothetical protein [Oscillospiraceae bacterium]